MPIATLLLPGAPPASAQTPGDASLRVFQRGALVGTTHVSLTRDDDGWRIQSTGDIGGTVNVAITQLDLRYDTRWQPRFMTLEMVRAQQHVLVHVAIIGTISRTDIVIPGRDARPGTNRISPGTTLLPDYAFGAYEALAAKLAGMSVGAELPLFIAPSGEIVASVDAIANEEVQTTGGTIPARHVTLTALRSIPTPIEIWIDHGRLLRLDLPNEELTVIRDLEGPRP